MIRCDVGDILYRATASYSPLWQTPIVRIEKAMVSKLTPKGFWIEPPPLLASPRAEKSDPVTLLANVVTDVERKWFSCRTYQWSSTPQEAVGHLVARKRAHVRHARRRLRSALMCLRAARETAGINKIEEEKPDWLEVEWANADW